MKDLTKGYPAKILALFALPLMLGNIFQQLYNMTDSKIVSEYVNTTALAAVGATAVISNTLIGFVNGMTQGFSILIARSFGEKNFKSLRQYVAGTIKLTAIVAITLTVFGEVFIKNILLTLKTPPDIFELATDYVRIIIAGIVCVSLYNVCANILRAVGDSTRPLICLLVSIAINVGLDLLFIIPLDMGIKGAAYATIIAQAISGIACMMFLLTKYKDILPKKDEWRLSQRQYGNLISSGASMGLMGCIVNLGTITLQSAINDLGTEYVTAHTAGRRVLDIMMVIIYTFGISMTTYVSQNLGAGKYARIRQGVRHAMIIDTALSVVLIIFTYTLGDEVVRWIASTDNKIILDAGILYNRVGVCFFFVLGPLFILRCTLQGLGQKIVPLVSSGLELVTKILFAFLIVPKLKYLGVSLTEPISWVIMTIPLIVVYILKRPRGDDLNLERNIDG